MPKRDLIAIGGSAGSTAVLRQLMRGLPRDLPAALLITTHVPSTRPSRLAEVLADAGDFPIYRAVDGQRIEPGCGYVAVEGRHLLVIDGAIVLGAGPRENMVRPAIDPMMRSAALAYGSRAVGVVVSGMLNDGASGLSAIRSVGGTTIVQHPLDAEAPEMPQAALEAVDADHVVRADELADVIVEVAGGEAQPLGPPSDDLIFEVQIAAGAPSSTESLRRFAAPAALTCPECHGVLSEVKGAKPLRYRCQIGHAYSADILAARDDSVEEAIRLAMRVMEERVELVSRMARDARQTGRSAIAELYEQRAAEYQRYARTLRDAAILSIRAARRPEPEDPAI